MSSVFPKLLRRLAQVALVMHVAAAVSLAAAQSTAKPALDPHADASAPDTPPAASVGRGAPLKPVGSFTLHVNGEGLVDGIAGSAPDPEQIDSIAALAVDPLGRLLVGNARTGAVHVFDGKGSPLFVCRPGPQDEQGCAQIAGAPDGRIFAGGEKGFVCYSAGGQRTGTTGSILGFRDEHWLFQPLGGKRWVAAYSGLVLADADGAVVRTIDKCSDGTSLTDLGDAAMAPDGSLAVLSASRLCLYAPDGEPRRTIPLPPGSDFARIAFDGKRVVLATGEALLAFELGSNAWTHYPFASTASGFSSVFFSPDGERIRLVPFRSAQVLEYRLAN